MATRKNVASMRRPADDTVPSRVDELCRQLADDIMEGTLLPGIRLDEMGLATRFGVSRTPVREALRQLEAMGLVQKRPNRGVVVTVITRERLTQMFAAMAELEAACARLAAQHMSAAERDALQTLHRASLGLVQSGDIQAYERVNQQFHMALYRGCHNGPLLEMAQAMRRRVAPFRRAQFRVVGRLGQSLDEHDKVVTCILRGDPDGAATAMRSHILTVRDASHHYVESHLPALP